MEVVEYLKDLLYRHECVVLPDFGAVLASYKGADIHPVSHRFYPPSKKLAFNEQLSKDDGVLIKEVAAGENISVDEATERVRSFVKDLFAEIDKNNFVEIKEVGKIYRSAEKKLEFQPDNKANYLGESFGLPEFVFKPIERNTSMSKAPHRVPHNVRREHRRPVRKPAEDAGTKKKKNPAVLVAVIIIPLLFAGAAAIFFFTGNKEGTNPLAFFYSPEAQEETNIAASTSGVEEAETKEGTEETADAAEAEVSDEAETTESETTDAESETTEAVSDPDPMENAFSGASGKYSIIIGSFEYKKNAQKLKSQIESTGKPVVIIDGSRANNFYKVSVAEYNNLKTAQSNLDTYRSRYGNDTWILLNK